MAMGEPVMTVDPVEAYVPAEKAISSLIYETLFDRTPSGVSPLLAKSWLANHDGTRWTIELKEGVKFHDGQILTAGDVAYSLRRALKSRPDLAAGPTQYSLSGVELETSDSAEDLTIVLRFEEPKPRLPEILSHPAFAVVPARAPPRADTRAATDDIPPGTGPYKLRDGMTPSLAELGAHQEHHQGRPFIDRIVWQLSGYDDAAIELRAGTVDLFVGTPSANWDREGTGAVKPQGRISYSTHLIYLACNPEREALGDFEDRLGVFRTIDRESMLKPIVGDGGRVAQGLLPGRAAPQPTGKSRPGEKRGGRLTLLAPRWHKTAGEVADRIQVYLLSAGYEVTVRRLARGEMGYKLSSGDFDMFVGVWYIDTHVKDDMRRLNHFVDTQLTQVPSLTSTFKGKEDPLRAEGHESGDQVIEEILTQAVVLPLFHMDTIAIEGDKLVTDGPRTEAWPDMSWSWLKTGPE